MKDHPIIFSAPMVEALILGRKTQTRRLAWRDPDGEGPAAQKPSPWQRVKRGDRLYVREAWRVHKGYDAIKAGLIFTAMNGDVAHCVDYLATIGPAEFWGRGRPSIHMPRWASRLTLTVTDVRAQRLQEISEEDACAEGAPHLADSGATPWADGFADLWNSLHGANAWAANPEVVALTFTVKLRNIDA